MLWMLAISVAVLGYIYAGYPALIGLWATLRYMPDFRGSELARFDLSGYVMLVVAMLMVSRLKQAVEEESAMA